MKPLLLAVLVSLPSAAQVCGTNGIYGPYGFQLSGSTTISGKSAPMAAVGRLIFDGSGHISGVSSVNFNGWYLGNPVTGTYEMKADCSLTWSLQDDSGAWQHFRGTVSSAGNRVDFTQTDPGADGRGLLVRAASSCSAAAFHGDYVFRMGTVSTPLGANPPGRTTSERTVTQADGKGHLSWKSGDQTNTGTYDVDSDCFMPIDFGVSLRGILVDEGRTVLAVGTDPVKVAVATFRAQ